jgi:hypothetical protein
MLSSASLVDGMNPANLPRLTLNRYRDAINTKLDCAVIHLLCLAFHIPHYILLSAFVNPKLEEKPTDYRNPLTTDLR